jgi:hypothetical protein
MSAKGQKADIRRLGNPVRPFPDADIAIGVDPSGIALALRVYLATRSNDAQLAQMPKRRLFENGTHSLAFRRLFFG